MLRHLIEAKEVSQTEISSGDGNRRLHDFEILKGKRQLEPQPYRQTGPILQRLARRVRVLGIPRRRSLAAAGTAPSVTREEPKSPVLPALLRSRSAARLAGVALQALGRSFSTVRTVGECFADSRRERVSCRSPANSANRAWLSPRARRSLIMSRAMRHGSVSRRPVPLGVGRREGGRLSFGLAGRHFQLPQLGFLDHHEAFAADRNRLPNHGPSVLIESWRWPIRSMTMVLPCGWN